MIIIEIPGNPIPLQRARATRKGFYDPQYQVKKNYAWEAQKFLPKDFIPINKPIRLEAVYYMKMPKSWSNKKKERFNTQPHTNHTDLSNMIKLTEDALNKILWEDDQFITNIIAAKEWAYEGKTLLQIEVLDD